MLRVDMLLGILHVGAIAAEKAVHGHRRRVIAADAHVRQFDANSRGLQAAEKFAAASPLTKSCHRAEKTPFAAKQTSEGGLRDFRSRADG